MICMLPIRLKTNKNIKLGCQTYHHHNNRVYNILNNSYNVETFVRFIFIIFNLHHTHAILSVRARFFTTVFYARVCIFLSVVYG